MPPLLVRWPERNFVGIVYPDPPGKLRMLFEYAGQLRALCWLQIGKDGSLYLNPRRPGVTDPTLHAHGTTDGAGGFATVDWVELNEAEISDRKLSYHASGWVKGGSKMTRSIKLRNVDKSTLIRQDDYAHPSNFEIVERAALRKADLVVPGQDLQPYRLDDGQPLTSRVYVAPLRGGQAEVSVINDDENAQAGQTAIVIPAIKLEDCQDLTYQVQFFSRSGDWPEMTTIVVLRLAAQPAKDQDNSPQKP